MRPFYETFQKRTRRDSTFIATGHSQLAFLMHRAEQVIFLPSGAEWKDLATAFESIAGLPNTCLAVDGTLIEIDRPFDYEGWYSRKLRPQINVQIVCDARLIIRSYSMRPGSSNDKSLFNRPKQALFPGLTQWNSPLDSFGGSPGSQPHRSRFPSKFSFF